MIRIISVMHTGTRFVVKVLQNAGYAQTHAYWANGDFIQVHFDGKGNAPMIHDPAYTGTVIIPLRKKDAVIASWVKRESKLRELEECWDEMERWLDEHGREDVFLLHVDDPERRETELAAIGERLGQHLIADFNEKVGHWDQTLGKAMYE